MLALRLLSSIQIGLKISNTLPSDSLYSFPFPNHLPPNIYFAKQSTLHSVLLAMSAVGPLLCLLVDTCSGFLSSCSHPECYLAYRFTLSVLLHKSLPLDHYFASPLRGLAY